MNKTINGKNQLKRLAQVRARIKKLADLEKELAKNALDHLKQYGTLKQDEWSAAINVTETRRPKWKEEFIEECGQEAADDVLSNTKATKSEKVILFKEGVKV